jgi:CRISPR-associated Cas5-like protein
MNLLAFILHGEMALWRNPEDSVGNLSCLGPAPSHLAGIVGAAFGWSSTNRVFPPKCLVTWPVAEELLAWGREHRPKVACRLLSAARRTSLNVNGFKNAQTLEYTRLQQSVLHEPRYEVVLGLQSGAAAEALRLALLNPAFRVFLGSSFCPAFILNPARTEPTKTACWARWTEDIQGDSTPFTRHVLDTKTQVRISKSGYWNYRNPPEVALADSLHNLFE